MHRDGRSRKLPFDPDEALAHLRSSDPKLAALIHCAGPFTLRLDHSVSPSSPCSNPSSTSSSTARRQPPFTPESASTSAAIPRRGSCSTLPTSPSAPPAFPATRSRLFATSPPAPSTFRTASENEQSRLVVSQIQELQSQGLPLKEVAVLVRAGYHSFDLEIELARVGLHFIKVGGFKFVESAHIKDILAYLRVLANPRDALSWHRLLLLVPGVGRQACAKFDAQSWNNFTLAAALEWLRNQRRPAQLAELAGLMQRLMAPGQDLVALMTQAVEFYCRRQNC